MDARPSVPNSQTAGSSNAAFASHNNGRRNQTPMFLDNEDLPEPDGPPPSYEEAMRTSPSPILGRPVAASSQASFSGSGHGPVAAAGGFGSRLTVPSTTNNVTRRLSAGEAPSPSGAKPPLPMRPSTSNSRPAGLSPLPSSSSSSFSASPSLQQQPAPGSVPIRRQFPQYCNLYGDTISGVFTLGEHQQTPLYAVRLRPVWNMVNPVVTVFNGPNPAAAVLLSAIDFVNLSDNMMVTLPPPLTGSTGAGVRIDAVLSPNSWSHCYRFAMEIGTTPANARREVFEWRHSSGSAINALRGAHDGWKLVRLSTGVAGVAGRPPAWSSAFTTSDGHEVVAVMADAVMSLTKHMKFAFIGTGQSGILGERWAVMAVTSALGIWVKDPASQGRR